MILPSHCGLTATDVALLSTPEIKNLDLNHIPLLPQNTPRRVRPTQRQKAFAKYFMLDDHDRIVLRDPSINICLPWFGGLSSNGYRILEFKGPKDARGKRARYRANEHRVLFYLKHGWLPVAIDHADQNRQNNRLENLRPSTNSQNNANVIKRSGPHQSTFKGVAKAKSGRWIAKVYHGNKKYHVGTFDDQKLAALAYDLASLRLHGPFACLNLLGK